MNINAQKNILEVVMKKNCVILKWNPGISSYRMIDYRGDLIHGNNASDWSIYEHDKVKAGDQFFMLKVGAGTCGIVAVGTILRDPAAGTDWRGGERKVYYSDYVCEFMVNPETLPILESSVLEDNIPGFDWNGGHSGVVLEKEQAAVLNRLYQKYLYANADIFVNRLQMLAQRNMYNDQLYIDEELFNRIQGE